MKVILFGLVSALMALAAVASHDQANLINQADLPGHPNTNDDVSRFINPFNPYYPLNTLNPLNPYRTCPYFCVQPYNQYNFPPSYIFGRDGQNAAQGLGQGLGQGLRNNQH